MAVIDESKSVKDDGKPARTSLQALTAAALILPGLAPAAAQDNEFTFQYGRYEESRRDLGEVTNLDGEVVLNRSQFKPITVDSLQTTANVRLADRIKFAFKYVQDTWSGATPVSTAPATRQGNVAFGSGATMAGASPFLNTGGSAAGRVFFDSQLRPIRTKLDMNSFQVRSLGVDERNVHTMSVASPEVRKEGSFNLTYEWDEATVSAGGGLSIENDYESRFANLGMTLDFNQKTTTVSGGLSYANSSTSALLNHDAQNYINTSAYDGALPGLQPRYAKLEAVPFGQNVLRGKREDWTVNLGLTQIVTKSALAKFGASYTRSTGYLSNPYKAVTAIFIDSNVSGQCDFGLDCPADVRYVGQSKAFLEQRPELRNQWSFDTGWVQYINPLDAALHFDYRFYFDDWGINAHTFDADWVQPLGLGWSVTPRVRYYSQSEADFYTPFLIAGPSDDPGNARDSSDNSKLPTQTFSSDHRLSGFGALSGGVTVSKQFTKGVRLDASVEYYMHRGDWKIGGGGEPAYADFNFLVANAELNVNFSDLGRSLTDDHSHHHHNMTEHEPLMPAGLMCTGGHMLNQEGDFMVGYVYQYFRETGNMLNRTGKASDTSMVANGYRTVPTFHDMHMHMIDLMYAPTDWFNIMVMPMFMDMGMNQRPLTGINPPVNVGADHLHGGHETGGIGDTLMFGMFKLFKHRGHHVNLGIGFSAPTGDTDMKLNRQHTQDGGFIHYQMQLGSGTWDFLPSLTYLGQYDKLSWGAQASGTVRMQNQNSSGYALGNMFQATAWGSYSIFNWLSGSVRGVYTTEGSISGRFNPIAGNCSVNYSNASEPCNNVNPTGSTLDDPRNYGGRFWDVGFGLNVVVPGGEFSGNHLSVEWLQPVHEDVNGFQLERKGSLFASWSYMF
ncbi:DUF3570 domain-containing protein [Methylotuvimicrobium buryatense]|uniref:DUF3570 domain-containing protein n=1 Tax=Methylotuvimicrobium buryatense TaxID=95641 RepID=UPI00034CF6AA|nr:DUF3570 domain-containing protein [Methylotuvimicrobium buryatense]